jgi:hypothetical protein
MTYAEYSGSAEQYISEYLDPSRTLKSSPTSEDEARTLWSQLNEVFAADGGTGIDEEDFVTAVGKMQERFGFPAWRH